ncbi:PDT domain-containing protein [Microdochium trichocladiopsis]|uniref:prephenate dehydratase n=1 Tax=Microdochium trichocladiopsis TaxID=1682393 RepID=A0A9P8YL53_9PEZI|nr:PDT domain-containing protein [Microdochium trichocladiopsis]KAH7041005.1 PDT domain-containing protein [Microdochium trichocladiopsis]
MAAEQPDTRVKKPVVCFLGPIASYSHQATLQTFPPDQYELVPVVTIQDVFDATQSGNAEYGVAPFENSTNGSVVFTLDHFADRSNVYPDISVCGEIYQDVHHCLVGHIASPAQTPANSLPVPKAAAAAAMATSSVPASGQCTPTQEQPNPEQPRVRPLHPLSHIQRIYSHPQAFGQCTRFLNAYLRGIETIDCSSTSRAAELARDDTTGTSAAISSAVAAQLTGTDVLAANIEDREDNTTRFFVLTKHAEQRQDAGDDSPSAPSTVSLPVQHHDEGTNTTRLPATKSLVSFTVPHRSPGALAGVLDCFRTGGLNLTSINSRPSQVEPFQYIFFVEFEGHRFRDPEGRVRVVLESVAKVAQGSRWLGSWTAKR